MIRLENVTKSYPLLGLRRHYVFRDLNLTIPSRRNVGIVGRNGAGKTTLLRMLGGVDVPDRGRVYISPDVRMSPIANATGTTPILSGRANARFACRIHGDDPQLMRERVEFIHRFSELGDFFDVPVQFYSAGMKARLNFAISMAFDYDCYLLDEITAAGDATFRSKATRTFKAKRGKAGLILVSHNLRSLQEECEAGIYIKDGQVIWYEDIRQALLAYQADTHTSGGSD